MKKTDKILTTLRNGNIEDFTKSFVSQFKKTGISAEARFYKKKRFDDIILTLNNKDGIQATVDIRYAKQDGRLMEYLEIAKKTRSSVTSKQEPIYYFVGDPDANEFKQSLDGFVTDIKNALIV